MRAQCLTVSNPFDPLGSRSMTVVRRPDRVRKLAPRGNQPCIAILNGKPLLRPGWRRRLRCGDSLMFCLLPRGGGGGGSNPLRTLLGLAVLAFAPWAAGALLGQAASTVLFGSFTLGQATSLGLVMAGQAAINALLPQQRAAAVPSASPTYTIGAQGNAARIEQPIPVQYGRMLAWPDFAAQPYTNFSGNEQYLYQLLCLGCGEFDVEEIRIEDTPISAFDEVSAEIIAPGGQVTLFPTNVITSVEVSGQELIGRGSGSYSWSGTVLTVTETAHGRVVGQAVYLGIASGGAASDVYLIATVTSADAFTVVAASGSGSGTVYIHAVVGGLNGFIASDAGTSAQRLSVDLVLPQGLYALNGEGNLIEQAVTVTLQARRVDDNGFAIGSWITLGVETLTDRTVTPQARSFDYGLATPGRYRFRAWRVDEKATSGNGGDQINLAGLRAFLSETQDFGAVTLIALKMRATNNLSAQASRRIGVLATRKLPVWNGTSWSAPVASRSIAWAIADAARNADHGAGLPDSRLDLAALLALDAIWSARGDAFNGRFDQAGTWWDAVSKIALAGRARIFMQGGRLRMVRDQAETLPVALFSMRNIKRGSFGIDYLLPGSQTADGLDMSYFDEATWTPRRVVAALPGSARQSLSKMELFGATARAQVMREGLYHAAANKYRRRIVRFATEMEGFIPSIGDLIAIQHDMPAWGKHAEAVGWNAVSRVLTLSEPVTIGEGQHYVGLRTRNGGLSGPWPVTAGATADQVILTEAPDMTPDIGSELERTHVVFGLAQSLRTLAKVTLIRPRGLYEVEIEAVVDDPSVHTADAGQTAPPIRTSALPRAVTRPVVTGLLARKIPGDATRAVLAWTPAPDAETYQVEMASGIDVNDPGVSWTRVSDTSASHQVLALFFAAQTLIRVRGMGLAAGPWVSASLGSLIPDMWNTDLTAMWTVDTNPMWSS